jgi:hypothetical protein
LAEAYAKENVELRSALEAKTREVETLNANVEALNLALRSKETAGANGLGEAAPPETVMDAVNLARTKLKGTVEYGAQVDEQVRSLNPTAGPPDKVLRYLLTLGELAEALDAGPSLGRSVPIWLRDHGVECSGESETTEGNREAKQKRTFKISEDDVYCEFHAKPADGVAPDRCVRIYFTVSDERPRIKIGYVGRHFD